MNRKRGRHDRGPPATAAARIEADEIVVGTDLVVADFGLVVIGEDVVVIGSDEATIEPEVVLISCEPSLRKRQQRQTMRCSKRVATSGPLTQ